MHLHAISIVRPLMSIIWTPKSYSGAVKLRVTPTQVDANLRVKGNSGSWWTTTLSGNLSGRRRFITACHVGQGHPVAGHQGKNTQKFPFDPVHSPPQCWPQSSGPSNLPAHLNRLLSSRKVKLIPSVTLIRLSFSCKFNLNPPIQVFTLWTIEIRFISSK